MPSNLVDPGGANIRSLAAITGEDADQAVGHYVVVLGAEQQIVLRIEHAECHVVLGVEHQHMVPHLTVLLATKLVTIHRVEHQVTAATH